MASSTDNVKLGVCSIAYDSVDLGYTKTGAEVEVATETKKVMVDQFGNSPINEYVTGRTCTLKTQLAETTLENLVKIMPGSSLITDASDTTKKKVVITNAIGTSIRAAAKKLVLHPIANAETNKVDDFTIPIAGIKGDVTFAYKLNDERVFNVTFEAYPDDVSKVLFVVGDEAAAA